jgi:hypothetical protein
LLCAVGVKETRNEYVAPGGKVIDPLQPDNWNAVAPEILADSILAGLDPELVTLAVRDVGTFNGSDPKLSPDDGASANDIVCVLALEDWVVAAAPPHAIMPIDAVIMQASRIA